MSAIDPIESAAKSALDYAELVEHLPALLRRDVRDLPRHPAVIAYVTECRSLHRSDADLRTARRNFNTARVSYEYRRAFRLQGGIEWGDGGRSVSLSAVIEARAEAMHWHKVIVKLETEKHIAEQKEQNRRHIVRHRLRSMGIIT
jgi:hypothetical protein